VNLWAQAMDDLHDIKNKNDLTVDQRLKAVEVLALLSISQELSLIQDQGIQPEWSSRTD
jgi:hypothetical protein